MIRILFGGFEGVVLVLWAVGSLVPLGFWGQGGESLWASGTV